MNLFCLFSDEPQVTEKTGGGGAEGAVPMNGDIQPLLATTLDEMEDGKHCAQNFRLHISCGINHEDTNLHSLSCLYSILTTGTLISIQVYLV
jgi:hypothetical protein